MSSSLPALPESAPTVTLDASAYRAIATAAGGDAALARAAGVALAERHREDGRRPLASPIVLWELLAVAAPPDPEDEDDTPVRRRARAERPVVDAAAAVARLAVAACIAHCAADPSTLPAVDLDDPDAPEPTPTQRLVIGDEPGTVLGEAVAGRAPKESAAWREYLASLALELGADPTVARAQRLAGPLAHVRDRATQAAADFADEIQDAIVAAYDAASSAWDDATSVGERQDAVTRSTEALQRVVAERRAERAWELVGAKAGDDVAGSAARIAAAFPAGVALWAAVLRRIVAGDVPLESRAWRSTLWGLQAAFVADARAPIVTADPLLAAASREARIEDVVQDSRKR